MAALTQSARLGAGCWLLCLQFFAAEALATLGWQGHYSYRNDFISALGAIGCGPEVCSHWHALMNGSFALQGVLIAAGTLLLPRQLFAGRLGGVARVLLLVSSAGVLAVAAAPADVNLNLHMAGARAHFLGGSCAMLLLGFAQVRRSVLPAAACFWAAGVALFGDLLLTVGNDYSASLVGIGTIERIAAYPFPLWLAWAGFTLLRRPAQ